MGSVEGCVFQLLRLRLRPLPRAGMSAIWAAMVDAGQPVEQLLVTVVS